MNIKLLLIVGLAFMAGLTVFSFLSPSADNAGKSVALTVQGDCELSTDSVCTALDNEGHKVSFSLSPRPVPLLKDVQVVATVQGLQHIRTAQVSIEGVNMYMGIQIIPLEIAAAAAESRLSGTMQLPICTSRIMEWKATLILQTADKVYRAAFPFTTTAS
jgi:hypothetical protein